MSLTFEVVVRDDGTTTVTGTSEGMEGVHIRGDDYGAALTHFRETLRALRPCSRKGCGRPLGEHEYGQFCP